MGSCLQGHHQGGELDRIYLVKVSIPKDMPLSCDGLAKAPFIYIKGKLPSHPLSAFLAVELFPILGRLKHLYTYSISPPRFFSHIEQRTSNTHTKQAICVKSMASSLSSSFSPFGVERSRCQVFLGKEVIFKLWKDREADFCQLLHILTLSTLIKKGVKRHQPSE